MHSVSVGTDTSLHYVIGCNSKPLSIRAVCFEGDAHPEHGAGLCPSASTQRGHPEMLPGPLCGVFGPASGTLPTWQLEMKPFCCLTLLSAYCNKNGRCSLEKV